MISRLPQARSRFGVSGTDAIVHPHENVRAMWRWRQRTKKKTDGIPTALGTRSEKAERVVAGFWMSPDVLKVAENQRLAVRCRGHATEPVQERVPPPVAELRPIVVTG